MAEFRRAKSKAAARREALYFRLRRKMLGLWAIVSLSAAVLLEMISFTLAQAPLRLSYDEMAVTPQLYSMKLVQVHGRVIDMRDANYQVTMRVNISAREYDFRENILVLYNRTGSDDRLFEGDVVDIRGIFRGLITYTGSLGNQIMIPAITAEEVIRQKIS